MKKTIFVVLMVVMVTTPCLSQEVEPDGLFSFEGTRWGHCAIRVTMPFGRDIWESDDSEFYFHIGCLDHTFLYYEGNVYLCDKEGVDCSYCNTSSCEYPKLVDSYYNFDPPDYNNPWTVGGGYMDIKLPIGFGFDSGFYIGIASPPEPQVPYRYLMFQIGLSFKVENIDSNWTAPAAIYDISPNIGKQGTTLTDVLITCLNTSFQDDPTVEVSFDPPDGLTVSNIDPISNTEIEFDLEIAEDAPTGRSGRNITITYDDGKQLGNERFFIDSGQIN